MAANPYKQRAVIRLKAGPEAPLNISRALQNPYCSIYVLRAGAAATPNSGAGGYSLTAATNTTAITSALMNLNQGTGRKLLQASGELLQVLLSHAQYRAANPDHRDQSSC